jgi:hypothetical protein
VCNSSSPSAATPVRCGLLCELALCTRPELERYADAKNPWSALGLRDAAP